MIHCSKQVISTLNSGVFSRIVVQHKLSSCEQPKHSGGHRSGILIICHRILPPFANVRMLGSPYSLASSWFILLLQIPCMYTPPSQRWSGPYHLHFPLEWSKTCVHIGPPGKSLCDISHISCGLEVF